MVMRIKSFYKFISEVNGTELVGMEMGTGFGTTSLDNNTIDSGDTTVIFSDLDSKFYTIDDYNQLYQDYLKVGGSPLQEFNKENLEKIIVFLQEKE
jgi:hypothetical protein